MASKKGPAIIRETTIITLGTLADVTALKGVQSTAITDDFRIIKSEFYAFASGVAAGEFFGFGLYLVNDDLTAQQIANALVNDGPLNSSDRDKQEAANRFVKLMAVSDMLDDADTKPSFKGEHNEQLIAKTVRWSFNKGVGFNWAVFNNSGGALTTGGIVKILATHYGVWL